MHGEDILAIVDGAVKIIVRGSLVAMSAFKLYSSTTNEVIAGYDRERDAARDVFKRWPVAACAPYRQQDGDARGAMVLLVWETSEDVKHKRPPIAFVRAAGPDAGFRAPLWNTPVSA